MYPHPYADNSQTTWNIEVHPGSYIELTFEDLRVESGNPECQQDYVLINDMTPDGGIKLLDRVCSVKVPSGSFRSSWNKMQVTLHADENIATQGFYARYQSITFQIPESLHQDIFVDCKFRVFEILYCLYCMNVIITNVGQ